MLQVIVQTKVINKVAVTLNFSFVFFNEYKLA